MYLLANYNYLFSMFVFNFCINDLHITIIFWILNLIINLPLPVSFIHSCFMLLNSILSFQLEELPLAFLINACLGWWISSAFVCLRKSLFLLHIWMITFLYKVFLTDSFYLSLFWEFYSIPSWPIVTAERSADSLTGVPL